jgi:CubicO group peptidase (beta-lactamase class C family)
MNKTIPLFFILIFIISCEQNNNDIMEVEAPLDWTSLDLSKNFEVGSRNVLGVNTDQLNEGIEKAKKLDDFYAMAIIYKGRLIAEEYNQGDADFKYAVWSVTKSVISALFGQLIDQNILKDEFIEIGSFYPLLNDSLKERIKVRDLLTMSSGIPDNTSYPRVNNSINFILEKELLYDPGSYWNYTSAGTHILSDILTQITGEKARAFAQKHLFSKLSISNYTWSEDKEGISNGGYGLFLQLIDMAKIGQLYLQNGVSNNEVIISSSWIQKSAEMSIPFNSQKSRGYGYLWWMRLVDGAKMYYAAGYGGQYIMIVPSKALVIAITSSTRDSGDYGSDLNRIFYNDIIGSFSSLIAE